MYKINPNFYRNNLGGGELITRKCLLSTQWQMLRSSALKRPASAPRSHLKRATFFGRLQCLRANYTPSGRSHPQMWQQTRHKAGIMVQRRRGSIVLLWRVWDRGNLFINPEACHISLTNFTLSIGIAVAQKLDYQQASVFLRGIVFSNR